MAGVNLTGASDAARVQSFVGTEGRTAISPDPIPGAVVKLVGLGKQVYDKFKTDGAQADEAAAATRTLDAILGSAEGADFKTDPVADRAEAAATAVTEVAGLEVGTEQRGALTTAAKAGQRINDAIRSEPGSERRLNIQRARELRGLIAKHPEMAKEFRSLLYGDKNFITDLLSAEDATAAQQAKVKAEAVGRVRNILIDAGYSQAADLPDSDVQSFADQSGYFQDIRRFQTAERRGKLLKAEYEAGKTVDDAVVDAQAEDIIPGARRAMMTGLDQLLANPGLDEAGRARAIDAFVLERTQWLGDQFPMLGADKIRDRFRDLLIDIPNLYRNLAGTGPERQAAENQMAVLKASGEIGLRKKYPNIDEVEFVSRQMANASQVLGPTWLLENRNRMLPVFNQFLDITAANESGSTPPQQTPTNRQDKQISVEAQAQTQFVSRMAAQFQTVTPEQRTATAQLVLRGLEHPDNRRTEAAMDNWIGLLASPQFTQVAKSQEFVEQFRTSTAHRSFENYLGGLDTAVSQVMSRLAGKVDLDMDANGVLVFKPAPGLSGDESDRVVRLGIRLRNTIMADANLYGRTPEEASRNFYNEYLRK